MRKPTTHDQALRAALQVARGNRRHTAAAVTGLVMLGGCGGDGDPIDNTPDDPDTSTVTDASSTAGDAQAFEKLLTKSQQKLFSLALGMLHDRDDAKDAGQETWIKAYKKLHRE